MPYVPPCRFKEIPIYDENGNLERMETPKYNPCSVDVNTIDVDLPLDLNDPVNLASVSASATDLTTPVDVDAIQASDIINSLKNHD